MLSRALTREVAPGAMNFPYDFQPYVKEEREAFHAEGRFHPQPWAHEPNAFWNEQQYPTYTNLNTNEYVFSSQPVYLIIHETPIERIPM